MGHAEGLVAPQESPDAGKQTASKGQKKRAFRGRCALFLLLAVTLAGYGAMIYFGQMLVMN